MDMEPGILIIGFCRPEKLISKARFLLDHTTACIHLSVDGIGPRFNSHLKDLVNRAHLEALRLKSTNPHRLKVTLATTNLGMFGHFHSAMNQAFEHHDSLIVIEDDVTFDLNFIISMKEGVKLLNQTLFSVHGFSSLAANRIGFPNFWYKSRYFQSWGWAITKENWTQAEKYLTQLPQPINDIDSIVFLKSKKIKVWNRRFAHTDDSQFSYRIQRYLFSKNLLTLHPVFRLSSNEGFGAADSTHTKFDPPKYLDAKRFANPPSSQKVGSSKLTKLMVCLDSNTWVGDGLLSKRSRFMGIRTGLKSFSRTLLNLLRQKNDS